MRSDGSPLAEVVLMAAGPEEFEELVCLRIEAMRESLERIGRFDPVRARERFRASFAPEFTRHILWKGERVGFVAVSPARDGLSLDHLYVAPRRQGAGIGSAVLALVFAEADAAGLALRVGALRESDSHRFYLRHGFLRSEEGEWDIYYVRPPRKPAHQ
jgi:GNAT superfamily N-acetyltransferase